jgi:hypothetical protein
MVGRELEHSPPLASPITGSCWRSAGCTWRPGADVSFGLRPGDRRRCGPGPGRTTASGNFGAEKITGPPLCTAAHTTPPARPARSRAGLICHRRPESGWPGPGPSLRENILPSLQERQGSGPPMKSSSRGQRTVASCIQTPNFSARTVLERRQPAESRASKVA